MPAHPPVEAPAVPDLAGAGVGRYLVQDRLGWGPGSAVYRAVERGSRRQVALKFLDPQRTASRAFVHRFVEETGRVADLRHPRVNPVYDVGTHGGLTYVGMRLVRGGSLRDHLRRRPLDLASASRVLLDVAAALAGAHQVGVVHGNLKPTNVLIDADGSACVTDFGLAQPFDPRLPRGTSGLAPEQLRGQSPDERTDVHALGSLFEAMLNGGAAPEGRALPAALGAVIASALAEDPGRRPQSVGQLLDRLALGSWRVSQEVADSQLRGLLEASFDPAFAVDREGVILHWNERAEQALGWPARHLVGQPLLATLIAPRYRELVEHLLLSADFAGAGLPDGHTVEVRALRRDGLERTLDVSISPLRVGRGAGGAVVFCRDVTELRSTGAAQQARPVAVGDEREGEALEALLARGCREAGVGAAAVWALTPDRTGARCEAFWHAPVAGTSELALLTQGVQRLSHLGAVDAAIRRGLVSWREVDPGADGRRARGALRAGFQRIGAAPICDAGGGRIGALEVFGGRGPGPGGEALAAMAASLAPRLARHPHPRGLRQRFVLDPATSTVGFSCAFMKLLTVHGSFRDVGAWMEIDGDDPATIRGGAVIKAASVATGSLDRDFHLCSRDFFNVERFPDLVFEVTRVGSLGDQCFRVLGELTIRDVTRPIRLDARLEDVDADHEEVRRITLTASSVIKRLDWFLDWERALQAGRWIVGDLVRLDLVLTLVRGGGAGDAVT